MKTVAAFDVEAPDTEEGGKIRTPVSTATLVFREVESVLSSLSSSDTSIGSALGSTDRRDRGRSIIAIQRAIDVISDLL